MADKKLKPITDLKDGQPLPEGKYGVKRGTFQIIDQKNSPKDYDAAAKGRNAKDRTAYLKQLTPEEQAVVKRANAEGKGVLWNMGNGKSYLFVPSEEEKAKARQKAEEDKKNAAAQGEDEGLGFWSKLGIGIIITAIVGYLGLRLFKDKDKKNNVPKQTNNANTGNQAITDTTNTQQPSLMNDGSALTPAPTANALGGNSGGGLINTMKTISSGTVNTSPAPSVNAMRGPSGHSL